MRLSFTIIIVSIVTPLFPQSVNQKIDSLERVIGQLKNDDSAKVMALRDLSVAYKDVNSKKGISIAWQALNLTKQFNSLPEQVKSLITLGNAYMNSGRLDSSLWSFEKGIALAKKSNDEESICTLYTNIGVAYNFLSSDYDEALKKYYKALAIAEKNHFPRQRIYGNIAVSYGNLKNFEQQAHNYSLALEEAEKQNATTDFKMLLRGNLAVSFTNMGKLNEATKILKECIAYRRAKNHKFYLSNHLVALGRVYFAEKKFDQAYENFQEALNIKKEIGSWMLFADLYNNLSSVEFKRARMTSAKNFALHALRLSDSLRLPDSKQIATQRLTWIAIFQHDLRSASFYDSAWSSVTDSLNLQGQDRAITELKTKYETEKKDQENELLKLAQLKQESELANQRYTILMITVLLVVTIVLLIVVYRSRYLFKKANVLLKRKTEAIEAQHKEITSQKRQIAAQMEELKMTQSQLIHSEKMASLGQFMAGIAHELNNPITFISAGTAALKDQVLEIKTSSFPHKNNVSREAAQESWQEVEDLFSAVLAGVDRTTKIVHSLRTFSYENSDGVQQVDLIECMEATLTMLQSETKNRIVIQKNYNTMPLVECNAGEISQVFMNIFTNAIHAIQGNGNISISTGLYDESGVFISIKDSGPGIPEHIMKRIFEPFFTTKPLGKGVGLGLSISYKIIEKHQGSISVSNVSSGGAEFIIRLPVHQQFESRIELLN